MIPGHEVKNGRALECELPPDTSHILEVYLQTFRPRLLDEPSEWLFPGRGAGHKSLNGLGDQIKNHLKREIGITINIHLFRHLSANIFLRAKPGGYGIVQQHLGHESIDTTTNFYTGFETASAARHVDEVILNLRTNGEAETSDD